LHLKSNSARRNVAVSRIRIWRRSKGRLICIDLRQKLGQKRARRDIISNEHKTRETRMQTGEQNVHEKAGKDQNSTSFSTPAIPDVEQVDKPNIMTLDCHSCGRSFDSTFTSSEFSYLPKEQYETGTLHLCPHCGNLSMYLLKDYFEK